jgi:O-antigen/teichoic acid export membrane protein
VILGGLKRQLNRPGSLLLGSTVTTLAFGLFSAAIQARLLGPIGRGELAVAMVPGTLLAMLLCFGLPDYFARKAAQGASLPILSKLAMLLSLAIGLVALIPYLLIIQVQTPVGSDAWWVLLTYAIGVPIFVYGYCLTGMLVGAGSWRFVAGLRVLPLLAIILGLLVIAVITNKPSPLVVGLLLVTISAAAPLSSLLKPALHPKGTISWGMVLEAFGFGIRGWPAGAIALLNQRVDLLVVTVIASAGDTGLYAVSTTLAAVLTGIANAIALPARNKLAQGERGDVAHTVALAMFVALIVASITVLLHSWCMSCWEMSS